jgi:hypothetical protein
MRFSERFFSRALSGILTVALLFPCPPGQASEIEAQDLERAVQNPLLWSHFSAVARHLRTGYEGFGGRKRPLPQAEVDAQTEALIEAFLKRVNRQSWELVSAGEKLVEPGPEGGTPSARLRADRLKAVHKAASNLRNTLSPVYLSGSGKAARSLAANEERADLHDLKQLVFSTYRTIQGYVFQEQHTVTVERLKKDDMVASLSRIQNTARRLQRQARAD